MGKAKPKPAAASKLKTVSKAKAPNATRTQVVQAESPADPFVPNEFGVIPPQTGGLECKNPWDTEDATITITEVDSPQSNSNVSFLSEDLTSAWTGNGAPIDDDTGKPLDFDELADRVSSANTKTENKTQTPQDPKQSPQPTSQDGEKNSGNVAIPDASADLPAKSLETLLPSHARLPGEGRAAFWERTRKALRALGIPRGQGPGTAYEMATRAAEREFPPPVPVIVEELPEEPIPEPPKPSVEPVSAPVQADQGVVGLGNFPADWPKLPANAQLQAEIAWVTANRLLVRDGTGVNLSRAMSPPPSYSALSWLETSILFPAKFADISVKATAETDDEREFIKRERFAIEEIRGILKEMLDAKAQT